MCIRDRVDADDLIADMINIAKEQTEALGKIDDFTEDEKTCLLYTSDAADERSSVDLGGRRIIKKKTTGHK